MKTRTVPTAIKTLALLALVALAAWWYGLRPSGEATPVTDAVSKVRNGSLVITASGTGTLQQDMLPLGFAVAGNLEEIARPGQFVAAGETLASLDSQKALLNVQNAEFTWQKLISPAELAATRFDELQFQEELADAQKAYNDVVLGPDVAYYQELLAIAERDYWDAMKAVAEARSSTKKKLREALPRLNARLDAAELAVEAAQADLEWALTYQPDPTRVMLVQGNLEAAQSQLLAQTNTLAALSVGGSELLSFGDNSQPEILPLQRAWANLELARQTLAAATLKAPFSGTVTRVAAQPGQQVSAYQPLLTLVADAPFTVQFSLDESDLNRLSVGDPFIASPSAYPNLELAGVITAIAPAVSADAQVTIWGEISPNDLAVKLMPGMNVDVTVTLAQSASTLLLSSQAIHYDETGSPYVNRILPDGSIQPTPVTLGLSDFANVEILSGLSAGDTISTGNLESK